jgi:hypothetical protein
VAGAGIRCRAEFVELVGRGKVGLALRDEAQQLVAIDGQQPMMGGPAAAAAAGSGSTPSTAARAAPLTQGQDSVAQGSSSGDTGGGADGSDVLQSLAAEGSGQEQQGPGSVVAVRLMTLARGWAAGTVAPGTFAAG